MASLYRKYRPIVFADVAGQEHIKQTLKNEIISGRTVQAYLFHGPRAVGKTSTARLLARALNCTERSSQSPEPCNACASCKAILDSSTLDLLEIDAASHTGVDNVRDNIIAAARVGTTQLNKKVFIIDEVHMLSLSAFNALLKVLEEPPSHVVFILATTELQKVPATIVSRCQRFDFKKISPDACLERLTKLCKLEKRECIPAVLEQIVRLSDGHLRDAESLLGQVLSLPDKKITVEAASVIMPFTNRELVKKYVGALCARIPNDGLDAVRELKDSGTDTIVFLNDAIDYLRDVMLVGYGVDLSDRLSKVECAELLQTAKELQHARIVELMTYLLDAHKEVRFSPSPYLPLEIALIRAEQE